MSNYLLTAVDDLVATINANVSTVVDDVTIPRLFPVGTIAAFQDDVYHELENEPSDPTVWVIGKGAIHKTINGCPIIDLMLTVVLRQKIEADANQQTNYRIIDGIRNDLAVLFRRSALTVSTEKAYCLEVDNDPSIDFERYNNDGLYLSEFATQWRMVDPDD